MTSLKRGLCFTDIHWGKKSNSVVHLLDCDRFIDWICEKVAQDSSIDHIMFLGDWFDHRTNLHIHTMHAAYIGAKKLNSLNIPVFFIIGNHDLHLRNDRSIYSTVMYHEFNNFVVVDQPMVTDQIGNGAFLAPYMFEEEYENLDQYLSVPFWAGHFEFKGFRITGYNVRMEHGPDPTRFAGPTRILSGHFHARQTQGNITYIGNVFPMDYGDVGDVARGCMVYDHTTNDMVFHNWDALPSYHKIPLSRLISDTPPTIRDLSYIKCVMDTDITYEASVQLKQTVMASADVREFVFEDVQHVEALEDTAVLEELPQFHTVDQLIVSLLGTIVDDSIDTDVLVGEYTQLAQ